jgi:hypothetical protein
VALFVGGPMWKRALILLMAAMVIGFLAFLAVQLQTDVALLDRG